MKKIILSIGVLVVSLSANCQSLSDNLLLHYSCTGNSEDNSGNAYHGIGTATIANDRFGDPNEAYSFNGVDTYIDFPNDPALKPSLPVSLAFWVKFDDNDAGHSTVVCTDFATDNHTGVWASRSGAGNMAVNYGDNTGNTSSTNRRTKVGNTVLQANVWYHVALVVNGPTDMEIYINCVNDGGSYSGSGGALGYSSMPGSVGRKDSGMIVGVPPNYFKGTMDALMYWDRALIASDMEDLCSDILATDEIDAKEDSSFIHSISVYPNPTNGKINLKGIDGMLVKNAYLLDPQGRVVRQIEDVENEILVSDLSNGIYFVKIESEQGETTVKFIKN